MLLKGKIEQKLLAEGFRILEIDLSVRAKNLDLVAERVNREPVDIEDCSRIVKIVDEIIKEVSNSDFRISASSAGVERRLYSLEDCDFFKDREVLFSLKQKKEEVTAVINGVDDDKVIFKMADSSLQSFPFNEIFFIKLKCF